MSDLEWTVWIVGTIVVFLSVLMYIVHLRDRNKDREDGYDPLLKPVGKDDVIRNRKMRAHSRSHEVHRFNIPGLGPKQVATNKTQQVSIDNEDEDVGLGLAVNVAVADALQDRPLVTRTAEPETSRCDSLPDVFHSSPSHHSSPSDHSSSHDSSPSSGSDSSFSNDGASFDSGSSSSDSSDSSSSD